MKFGKAQASKFGSAIGSYSMVTERENYDSQITLTDFETELLLAHFGVDQLQVGNVSSNPELSRKPFRRYPDGEVLLLNVVFPKPEKSELRLYLSAERGFKPAGGDVWFLFLKDNELWIGAQTEAEWQSRLSTIKEDLYDNFYQDEINETDEIKIRALKARDQFVRDRRIALARLEMARYECEYNSGHELFISKASGKPYLEAHHLIPIGLQPQFARSLDTLTNVYCLCPHCHRAVHYAEDRVASDILMSLSERRPVLTEYSIEIADLLSMYALNAFGVRSG